MRITLNTTAREHVANRYCLGTRWFYFVLVLFLSASCNDNERVGNMEPYKLNIDLLVVRQRGEIITRTHFTNVGKEPFPLERSLSGQMIPAGRQLFRVENEKGEEVPFIGKAAKMGPPHYPEDFVTIQPGAELSSDYRIDNEYHFDPQGQSYQIRYDVVNALPDHRGLVFLKSVPVMFSFP